MLSTLENNAQRKKKGQKRKVINKNVKLVTFFFFSFWAILTVIYLTI